MRLLAITTARFRNLSDRTWTFGPGLQIIQGPNEAGKSSLQEAILIALFANARSTEQRFVRARRWGESEAISVTLRFQLADGEYELTRDFEDKRNILIPAGGKRLTSPDGIQQALVARLPIPSEDGFVATACVRQEELAKVAQSQAELFPLLEAHALSGTGVNVQALEKALTSHVSDLRRGLLRPAINPGRLRQLRNEVERLEREAADLGARLVKVSQAAERLVELEQQLRGAGEELARREEHLQRHNRARELEEHMGRARGAMQKAASSLERRRKLAEAIGPLETIVKGLRGEVQDVETRLMTERRRSALHERQGALRNEIAGLGGDLTELARIEGRLVHHQQELLDLPLTRQDMENLKDLPDEIQRLQQSIAGYEERRIQEQRRLEAAQQQLAHLDKAIPQGLADLDRLVAELSTATVRRSIVQTLTALEPEISTIEAELVRTASLETQLAEAVQQRGLHVGLDVIDSRLLQQIPTQIAALEEALASEGLEVSVNPLRPIELRVALDRGEEVTQALGHEEVFRAVGQIRIILDPLVSLDIRNLGVTARKLRELEASRDSLVRQAGCGSWGELQDRIGARVALEEECRRLQDELRVALAGKTTDALREDLRRLEHQRSGAVRRLQEVPTSRSEEEIQNARLTAERELAAKHALRQHAAREIVERTEALAGDLAAGVRDELQRKERVYNELVAKLGPEGPAAVAGVEARMRDIEAAQEADRAARAAVLRGRTIETIRELAGLKGDELQTIEQDLGSLPAPPDQYEEPVALEIRLATLRQELDGRNDEFRNTRAELAQLDEAGLTAEYDQAALDAGIAQRELREVEEFRLTPDAKIAAEQRVHELKASVASLLKNIGATRTQAEEESGLQDRLAECHERIEALVSEEHFWDARAKVDETIGGLLSEARGRALADVAAELPRSTGAILEAITGGRHRDVRCKGLNFELWSSDKQGTLTDDEFSRGTLDQFYLGLRLAFVRTLFPGEPPPFLLDDPLVHCDPNRRGGALRLLSEYASSAQVLLFTCHDFADYASYPVVQI